MLALVFRTFEETMHASPARIEEELLKNRNRSVARSFYRHLRTEHFTHQQIIELSTTLLAFVTEDMREQQAGSIAK